MKNSLTITILGSGTCVPSPDRSACSVLVETSLSRILLDCGPGTMRRLIEAKVTVHQITHLFFSHFHPDHTGEMATFLFANRYATGPGRKTPLVMAGGRGFARFYDIFRTAYGQWIELPDGMLKVEEFDTSGQDSRSYSDFSVTTMPVVHNPESIAFRIVHAGKSVVYSGDTDESEELVSLAAHADLAIFESSMPDGLKIEGHLTPSLAGRAARKAGVKQLVLTHFYPQCETTDIEKQCRIAYDGPLTLAEDLMRMELL